MPTAVLVDWNRGRTMNILSKFDGSYQLGEQDGRFYYVYQHRPESCGYCRKFAERNDPNEINYHVPWRVEIMKELTAETLRQALFVDATETFDFNTYDLCWGGGHDCQDYDDEFPCAGCVEEAEEALRLEREQMAEDERNESAPYGH
jgi:hypothetical protein